MQSIEHENVFSFADILRTRELERLKKRVAQLEKEKIDLVLKFEREYPFKLHLYFASSSLHSFYLIYKDIIYY